MVNIKMQCLKCSKENISAYIHVQMYVDAEYAHRLTKKVLAKKSTEILNTSHDKTVYVCRDCGYPWGGLA